MFQRKFQTSENNFCHFLHEFLNQMLIGIGRDQPLVPLMEVQVLL